MATKKPQPTEAETEAFMVTVRTTSTFRCQIECPPGLAKNKLERFKLLKEAIEYGGCVCLNGDTFANADPTVTVSGAHPLKKVAADSPVYSYDKGKVKEKLKPKGKPKQ